MYKNHELCLGRFTVDIRKIIFTRMVAVAQVTQRDGGTALLLGFQEMAHKVRILTSLVSDHVEG